ncbi:MAG: hypothetical protein ACKPKO_55940, partial [Candidatus Fonsibacter sp.]
MLEASVSNKPDAAAAVHQETCDRQDREAAFRERRHKRGRQGSKAADWRPSKRYRRSSLQWLAWVDHQIRASKVHAGLLTFQVLGDVELEP